MAIRTFLFRHLAFRLPVLKMKVRSTLRAAWLRLWSGVAAAADAGMRKEDAGDASMVAGLSPSSSPPTPSSLAISPLSSSFSTRETNASPREEEEKETELKEKKGILVLRDPKTKKKKSKKEARIGLQQRSKGKRNDLAELGGGGGGADILCGRQRSDLPYSETVTSPHKAKCVCFVEPVKPMEEEEEKEDSNVIENSRGNRSSPGQVRKKEDENPHQEEEEEEGGLFTFEDVCLRTIVRDIIGEDGNEKQEIAIIIGCSVFNKDTVVSPSSSSPLKPPSPTLCFPPEGRMMCTIIRWTECRDPNKWPRNRESDRAFEKRYLEDRDDAEGDPRYFPWVDEEAPPGGALLLPPIVGSPAKFRLCLWPEQRLQEDEKATKKGASECSNLFDLEKAFENLPVVEELLKKEGVPNMEAGGFPIRVTTERSVKWFLLEETDEEEEGASGTPPPPPPSPLPEQKKEEEEEVTTTKKNKNDEKEEESALLVDHGGDAYEKEEEAEETKERDDTEKGPKEDTRMMSTASSTIPSEREEQEEEEEVDVSDELDRTFVGGGEEDETCGSCKADGTAMIRPPLRSSSSSFCGSSEMSHPPPPPSEHHHPYHSSPPLQVAHSYFSSLSPSPPACSSPFSFSPCSSFSSWCVSSWGSGTTTTTTTTRRKKSESWSSSGGCLFLSHGRTARTPSPFIPPGSRKRERNDRRLPSCLVDDDKNQKCDPETKTTAGGTDDTKRWWEESLDVSCSYWCVTLKPPGLLPLSPPPDIDSDRPGDWALWNVERVMCHCPAGYGH
ncbi:hypothetical protein CSUI_007304 [Cystoisospora suis]|uniref:Uncharacterized protein n=1 Tax=Cystoisospora suis TaxID=483139 RepID=A0A2C6KR33_9APIC|nr:hypothetical protein CSUI_007304 [Cystoisospora suis]